MGQAVRHKTISRATAPAVMRSPAPAAVATPRLVAPRVQLQALRVSSPKDPAEKEAETTAKKIMRMAAPEPAAATPLVSPYAVRFAGAAQLARSARQVSRKAEGQPDTGSNVAAELTSSLASGSPLPLGVRRFMEPRFGADFSGVRIHTDQRSATLNRQFSAQAFTYGNQIFFGRDRFRPETHDGRELIAHELTHTIQQGAAVQRREDVTVTQQSPAHVQRLGLSDALDYFADKANLIPGFRMFTIVLGVNPINMSRVERSAANIMRAVVEFIPGGGLITRALDRYGVFDRVGGWVEEQIRSLGMAGSAIRTAINRFLDSLSWRDIFDLGGVWDRAKRIFTEPIDRIISFARNLIGGILRFIRDAVLRPLAALAQNTRGYDMLKVVLGQDPITGDPYPRTPENVIGGFMRLIGQEEKWRHLQESRAIPRAWAWFQAQIATLIGFVRQVPGLFIQALQSLQVSDLLDLPGVFTRMRGIFGGFLSSFFSWAASAALQIMMFIFEALAPGAMPVLRRAASVIRTIIAEPIRFVGNLVRAGLQGFRQFGTNIRTHLVSGLVGWLTGALTGAGLQLPAQWDLRGILSLVLQILGLTWQNIRQKLVRVMGETAVGVLETTFDIVLTLVREGPAAAWQKIVEQLQNLQEMVFGQIRDWVVQTVVTQAVIRIVSMLNPAGAVIQAIIAIYNTIMFFRERLQQIIQVAESFFNSIAAIASGSIGAAADRVEQTMGRLVPVVISFLARLIGLGGISDTIRRIIDRVRAPIDRALDRLVDWIAAQARRLGRLVVRTASRLLQWWRSSTPFTDESGQRHQVRFQGEERSATLIVESTPIPVLDFLLRVRRAIDRNADLERYRPFYNTAVYLANEINAAVVQLRDSPREEAALIQQRHDALQRKIDLLVSRTLRVLAAIDPDRAAAATAAGMTEYDVQRVHALVVAEARNTNANVLRGHGRYAPGYTGRSWTVQTHDQVDAIGYADGDHSDPSIRHPGTSSAPRDTMAGTESRRLGRAHWIPDHQPPNEIAVAGGQTVRFYPHSWASARRQGGAIRQYLAQMTERLGQPITAWARHVRAAWFW